MNQEQAQKKAAELRAAYRGTGVDCVYDCPLEGPALCETKRCTTRAIKLLQP